MSVYFAQAGRYTKVGYSANPFERVATVTTNGTRPDDIPHGADATLLGFIPGDSNLERAIHRRFADRRIKGEWFILDEAEVRDLIWSDPRGVDIHRMSAHAVLLAFRYPTVTRDELAAAGIRIEATDLSDALARMSFVQQAAS